MMKNFLNTGGEEGKECNGLPREVMESFLELFRSTQTFA